MFKSVITAEAAHPEKGCEDYTHMLFVLYCIFYDSSLTSVAMWMAAS